MSPRNEEREEADLFIGWAPATPQTIKSALGRALVLSVVVVVLGGAIAGSMRSPGADLARFRPGEGLVGLLVDGPTPVLLVPPDAAVAGARPRAVLLSSMGRSGPEPSVLSHAGEIVTLRGNLLERGGRQMLEVGVVEAASVAADVESLLRAVRREPMGRATLRGEIVDSKCYLGRMRPGAGRTHRACAQSCIGGGVAPILVTHEASADGEERHYALEDDAGGSVRLELLPFVTEPVEISGAIERFADLYVVHVAVERLRRL